MPVTLRPVLLMASLLLAGFLAGQWLRADVQAPAPVPAALPTRLAAAAVAPQDAGDAMVTAEVPAAAISSPLPAATVPLAQSHAELVRLARAGHAEAALRLHREGRQCRAYWSQRKRLEQQSPVAIAHRAPRQLDMDDCDQANLCAGTNPAHWRGLAHWLLLAAQAGDVDAQVSFAAGHFLVLPQLDALDLVPRYRQLALPWLQAAALQGHATAAALLAQAYAQPDGSGLILGDLVVQDAVQAMAWLAVAQQRSDGTLEADTESVLALAAHATAAQHTAAQALVADLQRRLPAATRTPAAERQRMLQLTDYQPVQSSLAQIAQRSPQCVRHIDPARLQTLRPNQSAAWPR